jgi:hypothetical protein
MRLTPHTASFNHRTNTDNVDFERPTLTLFPLSPPARQCLQAIEIRLGEPDDILWLGDLRRRADKEREVALDLVLQLDPRGRVARGRIGVVHDRGRREIARGDGRDERLELVWEKVLWRAREEREREHELPEHEAQERERERGRIPRWTAERRAEIGQWRDAVRGVGRERVQLALKLELDERLFQIVRAQCGEFRARRRGLFSLHAILRGEQSVGCLASVGVFFGDALVWSLAIFRGVRSCTRTSTTITNF